MPSKPFFSRKPRAKLAFRFKRRWNFGKRRRYPKHERKFSDTIQSPTAINNTGVIVPLNNAIAEGTAADARVGVAVTNKSTLTRWAASFNASSADNSQFLRFIFFLDKQANAGTPAVTDLLETASFLSPINNINTKRFKVIWDRDIVLNSTNAGPVAVFRKIFKKLRSTTRYSDSTGTPQTNALYFLAISADAANGPLLSFFHRLRYTDD